jgi:hypothetical protein
MHLRAWAGGNVIIISGYIGSDAGYTYIDSNGGIHHVGGWGTGQLEDFRAAVRVMKSASSIKAPGAAAEMLKSAQAFIEKELQAHVKSEPGERILVLVGE